MQRRTFIRLVFTVVIAGTAALATAQSGTWPQKPIRLLIAAPAGSAPDIIARIVGEKMSQSLGQPVLVDNRPGAGGIIAMNLMKAATADGYTLALPQAAVVVVTPYTYKEASYSMERDFETVAMMGKTPMMFVTNMSNPARNLADAIAAAKAKPGEVAIGNPTRTSIPHLAAEMLAQKTGAKFQQVSFATPAQGIQAVVNGDTAYFSESIGALAQLVKGGKLRALAVASETELPGLEGMPLANKTVPGLDVYGWFTLQAPKGTPAAIIQKLNTEVNQAMQQPDVAAKFREFGTFTTPGSVADAQRFVKSETALFSGAIQKLGLKPE